jgi:hypothetical protein
MLQLASAHRAGEPSSLINWSNVDVSIIGELQEIKALRWRKC